LVNKAVVINILLSSLAETLVSMQF